MFTIVNKTVRQESVRDTTWGYMSGPALERRADYEDNRLLEVSKRDKEHISKANRQSKRENKVPNSTIVNKVKGIGERYKSKRNPCQ